MATWSRYTVGGFNLNNLILPNVTYYGNKKYNQTDYDRKMAWIGGQLDRMDCDLVGFQEVFQRQALQEAMAKSTAYDGTETLVTGDRSVNLGPMVALLSRKPVLDSEFIEDFPDGAQLGFDAGDLPLGKFQRPVLKARVEVRDWMTATVLVAHLKSKRPRMRSGADEDDFRERAIGEARSLVIRAAEAIALRTLILQVIEDSDRPLIIIGDLNDNPLAVTTQIITSQPPWKYLSKDKKQAIWDAQLYSVVDTQSRRSTRDLLYSYIYNGYYQCLDHICVSQELYYRHKDRLGRLEYANVLNDHLLDETMTKKVPKWQSDHGQVVAVFRLDQPGTP